MFQNDNVVYSFRGPLGVQVDIGSSILFLLGMVVLIGSRGNIVGGMIFAAMIVISIYLHELGHAWGNKVQGIPVRRIMLHGFGGFCEPAGAASNRERELVVAMGPIVNLALWALAGLGQSWIMSSMIGQVPNTDDVAFAVDWVAQNQFKLQLFTYLSMFGYLNIALFFFNMLPVQPLDGGKLFHLLMLRFLPPRAAQIATGWVGLIFSIIWIPAAILMYVSAGFILFFFPSIRLHWEMAQGRMAF